MLLDNLSAHGCKALKDDFYNKQLLLQRINSEDVNPEQLDSWIKRKLEREDVLNLLITSVQLLQQFN